MMTSGLARKTTPRSGLLLIIGVAALMRVALALQGGQYYFGDEGRFARGVLAWIFLRNGELESTARALSPPDHTAFGYMTMMVSAGRHWLAGPVGIHDVSPDLTVAGAPVSAALLGLFSTLNIWLVWKLARQFGAGHSEALFATLLAAASVSLLQYSRHLLPYDCALSAALCSLWLALRPHSILRTFFSGAMAGLCFELYNGSWFWVPTIGLAVCLVQTGWWQRLRTGLPWTGGVVAGLALPALPALLTDPGAYFRGSADFSRTVLQGVFSEGWSLPWAYFWHAEGGLGVLVGALILGVLLRSRWIDLPERVRICLIVVLTAYGLIVVTSVFLEKFVVYARTARALVPFLCLLGGFALDRLAAHVPWRKTGLCLLVVAGAAINTIPLFLLTFPHDLAGEITRTVGIPKVAFTYSGVYYFPPPQRVTRPDLALVNAVHMIPLRHAVPPPAGQEIFSIEHPAALPVYQYDGYTPRERGLLREHKPFIKLIRLAEPARVPDRPSAEMLFNASERPDGRDGGRPLR